MMKIIMAAIAAMTISTAANAEATSDGGLCQTVAEFGEIVMEARQKGMSKGILLAFLPQNPTNEIEKLVKESQQNIIEMAYIIPVKVTESEKSELVKDFGQHQYNICIEAWK